MNDLQEKSLEQKRLKKAVQDDETKKWILSDDGNVQLIYQTVETNADGLAYNARSFEDSFVHVNGGLLFEDGNLFTSLTDKHLTKFKDGDIDVYDFVDKAIGSKPSFAIEILLNSKEDVDGNQFSNWVIPSYLKEGLKWLKEN